VEKRAPIETMTVKLDMRTGVLGGTSGSKKLEDLLRGGWEIVSERKKSALEWGFMTEYTLRRDNR
jgi:hypothetical protein